MTPTPTCRRPFRCRRRRKGDDARVRRRPSCPPLITLPLLAACGGAAAWEAPDWRPAAPPQRIVAGSILATEVLLELAPRERIAAVHELAANPDFALTADAVRGWPTCGAAPERLLAARPDLVIVDAFTRAETLALLRHAGVPVVRTADAASFADVAANVRRIGRVCHQSLKPIIAKDTLIFAASLCA